MFNAFFIFLIKTLFYVLIPKSTFYNYGSMDVLQNVVGISAHKSLGPCYATQSDWTFLVSGQNNNMDI